MAVALSLNQSRGKRLPSFIFPVGLQGAVTGANDVGCKLKYIMCVARTLDAILGHFVSISSVY